MDFFKHNKNDRIFWANGDHYGDIFFTFDKEKIFNLFKDYPWALSKEEKAVFDRENPFWASYFKERTI